MLAMSGKDFKIASWSLVPDILKILETNFPDSLAAYNTLALYAKWKTKDLPDLEVILLTPAGKVDKYGTFLLCAIPHRNFITIYSLNPDVDEMKSLILNSKHIPWDQGTFWAGLHEKYHQIIAEIFEAKNLKRVFPDVKGCSYMMDKELAKKITISCPPEVYLDHLREDQAELIDFYWPHREKNSAEVGRFMIKHNGSVGLYEKESNELIAWALIIFHDCPGQLYVMDKWKRKGYGTLVAKAITKMVAEKDVHPVIMSTETNISQELFKRIGYKKAWNVYWCCTASQE